MNPRFQNSEKEVVLRGGLTLLDWSWVHPMETDTAWAGSHTEADQPLETGGLWNGL